MSPRKRIQKALQTIRILRHQTYKKAGVIQHRKSLDLALHSFLIFLIGALVLLLLWSFFKTPTTSSTSNLIEVDTAMENVHPELDANAPVVSPDNAASLSLLERQASQNKIQLKTLSLEPKESLYELLTNAKISAQEALDIADALNILINIKTLKPGEKFYLFLDKEGAFLGLSMNLRNTDTVAVLKEKDGSLTPFSAEGRVETVTERITGTIERTFAGSAQKAGVPDSLIAQITGALDGEIDFNSDIKPGQTFEVIFEKKITPSGLELGDKELLYIGLEVGKHGIHRYAWTDGSKVTTFYNARGISAPQTLYKRPLKARARLSSGFGNRRHPILLYEVFHKGVDLAAPTNTPIFAAGDGVIVQLGRKGSYGKYIKIKHAGGYETAYAHMNGYRGDLKIGSIVKRGETIGYVGSTGRSTGPHLHFEVIKNNKVVSPFGTNVIQQKRLTGFELEQFQSFAEQLHPDYAQHLAGPIPPVPTPKPENITKSAQPTSKKGKK